MKTKRVVLLNTYSPYCPNVGLAILFVDGHIETLSKYDKESYPSFEFLLTATKEIKYNVNVHWGNKKPYVEQRCEVETLVQSDFILRIKGVLDALLTGSVSKTRANNIFVFKTVEAAIAHFEHNPLNRTKVKGELGSHAAGFRDIMVKYNKSIQ